MEAGKGGGGSGKGRGGRDGRDQMQVPSYVVWMMSAFEPGRASNEYSLPLLLSTTSSKDRGVLGMSLRAAMSGFFAK